MIEIKHSSYDSFINDLTHLSAKAEITISGLENLKTAISCACTENQLTTKISEYIKKKHYLFASEAAYKQGWTSVSTDLIVQWQTYLDKKMEKKFGSEEKSCRSIALLETDIGKIINKTLQKRYFPELSSPKNTLPLLYLGLKHPMSHEIVFRHYQLAANLWTVPDHVEPLFHKSHKSEADKFLVKDYGPLKKYLWFPESERGKITDEFITESLSLLINLRQLDLTGCNQLTSACLKGHPQLEKLILDKTNLCPTDVRQADFPKLKEIVKDHNRLNLTLSCCIDSLRLDALYEADEINCTSIRKLLTEIVQSPNEHGINVLKALYFNKHKIPSHTSEIIAVSRLVSDALIKIWKNLPPSDWNTPWSLGEKLLRDLIEIWEAERIRAEQEDPISKAFRDELSFKKNFWELDSVTGIGHETSYIITITESDLSRVYALLNALHGKTWGAFSGIIADIGSILISCSDQLFHKEISNTFIRGEDSDLVRIKMLQAIFVALSHNLNHSASLNIDYFLRLTDPNTVTKTIEVVKPSRLLKALDKKITKTLYPSKFFAQFTDHALACAFVMNVPNITLREYLLWHLLDSFREYHTINNYYSLPKIILGVVEEKDLPPKEFDSPLRKYLLQYKGVFAKNVSDKLKNAFWEALCEGHFDGHTQNALEGFNLFLNGLEKDSPYREKTLTAIEQLSKRLDKSRISQPV